MDIGTRIGDARRMRRLSQAELARRADLSRNTISRIEVGAHVPEMRTVMRIADVLGVSPFELYDPQEFSTTAPKGEAAGERERRLLDALEGTIEAHTEHKLYPHQREMLRLVVGDLKWRSDE